MLKIHSLSTISFSKVLVHVDDYGVFMNNVNRAVGTVFLIGIQVILLTESSIDL